MRQLLMPFKRLILQLLLLLAIYFISRLLFTLVNINYFKGLGIVEFIRIAFKALRFDLSALLIINIPYIVLLLLPLPLWRIPIWLKSSQLIFILINAAFLIFEVSDMAYFPFNQKRTTADIFDMIATKGDFWVLLPSLLKDYWFVPLVWAALMLTLFFMNRVIVKRTPINAPESYGWIKVIASQLAIFLLVAGLSVIGIRGGLQYIPIGLQNAAEVSDCRYSPIVVSTPFSILQTYFNKGLKERHFMPDSVARSYVRTVKQYNSRSFQKKNVVVIILESFSKEFTGLSGNRSYTPFLDSLMYRSLVCRRGFANASHSIDGVPAIVAGLPSFLDKPILRSPYATDKITALPALLKDKGYQTVFYHGATNGSMNFDLFAASAGYNAYYGRKEYNNEDDYDGNWGIWDEPFLQYFSNGLTQLKEPFMGTVFTLTSHPPYNLPDKYKNILPKGDRPIEQVIAYSDLSLRRFFETASRQPWYNNTLFILTADHCSPMSATSYCTDNLGRYEIPIIFYAPGDKNLKGVLEEPCQQIDIMPSVLDYLGYNEPFYALGNSIFERQVRRCAVNYICDKYQLLADGYLLQTNEVQPYGLFAYPSDSACQHNLLSKNPDRVSKMLPLLQAYIQNFESDLIHNKLWIEPRKSIAGNKDE